MAISKKSLGKVLALSMASAMAMSSLSAALVSVAAVQDPALASNGSVGFYNDGEKQIVAALRGAVKGTDGKYTITGVGDNKEVDTIVGNKFELAKVFDESFFEKILEYTDSDDLAVQDLDVTKVTYRVSSGGSYASVKDDILTAKKAGTATLQIKVTADVDLGGGKSDKEVTFTHNVNIIVHDNAEIGLVAYNSSAHTQYNRLTNDQLNDIAAYNADKLEFQLVSFRSQGAGTEATGSAKTNVTVTKNGSTTTETIDNAKFAAIAVDASIGDSATSTIPEDKPQPGQAIDKVVDADNLSKAGLANSANAIAAFKALLTDTNGTVTIAPAANIPAKLQALVTAGTIKTTDVLIPESTTGAGDAVTVDDVIKDTTPAAGTPAQKLKDALDKAVSDVDKPGDTTTPADKVEQNAGVPKEVATLIVDDKGAFNSDAYTVIPPNTTVLTVDQAKAETVVNALASAPAANDTLEGLRVTTEPNAKAGASFDGRTAVLGTARAGETKIYFAKDTYKLEGLAAQLLVEDTASTYKAYVPGTGLSEDATVQGAIAIKVYEVTEITGTKSFKQSEVTTQEMEKIVAGAQTQSPNTPVDPGTDPDPEQPTVPPTVSDIILVPANLAAAGLAATTDAQAIFQNLLKTDANGEAVVLSIDEMKTALSAIVNKDATKADIELAATEQSGDQKIKVSDVIADTDGTGAAKTIHDKLVAAAKGATPGAALALKLDDAGVPSKIAGQIVNEQGAFVEAEYNKITDTTPVLVVNQKQAEAAVDAVITETPAANDPLADGLYVTEVNAGQNTQKVYFAKADYALTGLAKELLEADTASSYKAYVLADGTLSETASTDASSENIKVYKLQTLTTTKGLTKAQVPAADMQKIVDVAKKAVTPDSTLNAVAQAILDKVTAKATTAQVTADAKLTVDKIKTFLTQDSNGLITLDWTNLKKETAFTILGQGTPVEGYKITPAPFNAQLKKDAVDFTVDDAATEVDTKATDITGSEPATLDAGKLYKWTDSGTDYYFVKDDIIDGNNHAITNLTEEVGDQNSGSTLADLIQEVNGATLVHYNPSTGLTATENDGGATTIPVTVVEAKTQATDFTDVVKTPAVPFTDATEWNDYVTAQITADITTKETLNGVTYIPASESSTQAGPVNKEYTDSNITAGTGKTNLVYTIETLDTVGTTGGQDTVKTMGDLFFSTKKQETNGGDTTKEDIDTIVETAANVDTGLLDVQSLLKAVKAAVNLDTDKLTGATLKSVRFYAGNGAELFNQESTPDSGKWEKSTKGGSRGYEVTTNGKSALMELSTKGTTGAASVKAYVVLEGTDGETVTEEYVLNLKIVKAADFGTNSVRMTKSGSKTLADKDLLNLDSGSKSLSGYEIRTTGNVEVADGNIGTIKADGEVKVDDGKTGDIIEARDVKVSGATVGNIVDATGSVELTEGTTAGRITTDGATGVKINDATVSSIDADCPIDLEGGEINGNVITTGGTITITSEAEDADGDIMDVIINGSVISKGKGNGKVSIDNESDEGAAEITIRGDVIARYADIDDNEESVKIGSSNTTGNISIGGAVQGEHIILGGNGLVTLGAVNAVNEVERKDDEGIVVDSTLEFQGFNAGINNINKFANVTVSEGTVSVVSPLTTTTLDVQSDTQIVLAAMTVEDITGDGNIVVPAGQMVINGNVDDTPSLTLLGDVEVGTLAYSGDKGLSEAFDLGGLTLKAERQTNGTFNYTVSKQELYGVKAVGKNVTVGKEQAKSVSVVTDAALPQGASILWRSDDAEVATVEGNGNTATITGVDIGSVDVTATIVDANGRDLGYENATFNVDVLHANTIEVVGSEIALDTKAVGLDVGQSYSFLVRENSDVDNITLSYDSNIVDVALAQADYNGRGALYTITAKANGSTNVTVNYKGASSSVAVKVGGFKLDTAKKDLAPGQTYSFLAKNVPADQAANVKLEYDTNVATVALAQADYNGRGALFTVTGNQVGSTEIKATYNNEEAVMAVNVVEYTGRMTLDTASYTMPFGGTYTIGVQIEQNGRRLSGEEVNAMIARGELRVRDSRTGTIINAPQVLANGNVRVTGKSTEGTTYVLFEVVQNGQVVTHASVGVTVQAGAQAHGSSRRSISQW